MQTNRIGACLVGAVAPLLLAGCATVTSTPLSASDEADGLVYRLPQQHIAVTLTVTKEGRTLQVAPAAAIPDYAHPPYVLRTGTNALATRTFIAEVDQRGLLASVQPTVVNKLSATLQQLASASATTRVVATQDKECSETGVYTRLLDPKEAADRNVPDLCNLKITARRLFTLQSLAPGTTQRQGTQPGIYYRQQLPYQVQVDGRDFLVFSSTESPTYFLPLRRTVFSDTNATITLSSGVLTKVDAVENSEILALLILPADILGAYFGAIGKLFGWRTAAATTESDYLKALSSLASEKLRTQACLDAIQAGRPHDELKAICGLAD